MNKPAKPSLVGAPFQMPASGPVVSKTDIAKAGGDALRGPQYLRPELVEAAAKNSAVAGLRDVHEYFRSGFLNICEALQTNDPTKTPEGNFMTIKTLADKRVDEAARRGTAATNNAKQAIVDIDAEIERSLPTSDHVRAGEIRAYFRNLKKVPRISLALEAIKKDDRETIAALLSGPAYLSDFTDEDRNMLRNRYAETHMPEKLAIRNALELALKINFDAFNQFLFAVTEQIFPRDKVAEVSRKTEAAKTVKDAIFSV